MLSRHLNSRGRHQRCHGRAGHCHLYRECAASRWHAAFAAERETSSSSLLPRAAAPSCAALCMTASVICRHAILLHWVRWDECRPCDTSTLHPGAARPPARSRSPLAGPRGVRARHLVVAVQRGRPLGNRLRDGDELGRVHLGIRDVVCGHQLRLHCAFNTRTSRSRAPAADKKKPNCRPPVHDRKSRDPASCWPPGITQGGPATWQVSVAGDPISAHRL